MGLAKQTIARAHDLEAKQEEQRRYLLKAAEATTEGASHLWDDLREYIEGEVRQLVEELPAAEFLRSSRFGDDNLTVQTSVVPMVKLEIWKHGMYLTATCVEFPHGLSKGKNQNPGRFRFTVDDAFRPCFTDESGNLHPRQVGDRLLTPVFDFVLRYSPMNKCFW